MATGGSYGTLALWFGLGVGSDVQDIWQPTWLVELHDLPATASFYTPSLWFGSSADSNFSLHDLEAGDTFYSGRVIGDVRIEKRFLDVQWGVIQSHQVTLSLTNVDRGLTPLYAADLRRQKITIKRYDLRTQTTIVAFTGVIANAILEPGVLVLTAIAPDLSLFEQELPKGRITAELFTATAKDIGVSIPVVIGNVERRWLPCVQDNVPDAEFDYLVSRGAVSVTAVYRDGPNNTLHLVNPAEYVVETNRYPGFTTLRFAVRQLNFANGYHSLFADVTGLQPERNWARAIRSLLSDTTYGLGQAINAASFDAAETVIANVGDFYCDGSLSSPRQAQDVLSELLLVRGGRLDINGDGEWTLTIDDVTTSRKMHLQDGPGDGERNILSIVSGLSRSPLQDTVSTLRLRYREENHLPSGVARERLEVTRTVFSTGRERVIEHSFIRNSTTADKVVDYLSKRLRFTDESLALDASQQARQVVPGDVVLVTYPALNIDTREMEVQMVETRVDTIRLVLTGWSAEIYEYDAGTLPSDTPAPTTDELAQDVPATPAGLTATPASAAVQADGTTISLVDFAWDANTEVDLKGYELQFKRTADATWTVRLVDKPTITVREPLIAGVEYQARIRSVDIFGNESAFSATVTFTPLVDAAAPSVPTGLTATANPGLVSLDWNDNTEADLGEYIVYRHTSDDPGSSVKIAETRASRFVDTEVTPGQQYFYWITAIDRTENESAKTASVNATPTDNAVDLDPPSQPAAFSKTAEGTYLAADGHALAYLDFTLPAMPSGGALLNVLYKESGAAQYQIAAQVDAGSVVVRIDDLTPGRQYDVAVRALSNFGVLSTARVATSSPFTAPGDTTAPSAATAITVRQGGAKIIEIEVTFTEPADWATIELYRNTIDDTGTATLVTSGRTKKLHDQNVEYNTLYYYWVKIVDYSGNKSGFSSSADATLSKVWQVDVSGPTYVDETTDANDVGVDDWTIFPAGADADYAGIGFLHKFSKITINVGVAGQGTYTVTWQYWNGSAWAALSGVSDGTTGFKTAGQNNLTFTLPSDWAVRTLGGSAGLYWIRALKDTGTVTTAPLGTQAFIPGGGNSFTIRPIEVDDVSPLAIGRSFIGSNAGGSVGGSEAVIATFTDCVFVSTTDDIILGWMHALCTATDDDGDVAVTTTVRVRVSSVSGTVVAAGSVTRAAGKAGGTTSFYVRDFFLYVPTVTGSHTFVFTGVRSTTAIGTGGTVTGMKLLLMAKSR